MQTGPENSAKPAKRPYEVPALTRRESLPEVTAVLKKGSAGEEKPKTPCWVARTVYGEENPRWLFFRAWLLEDAPAWLRAAYLRYGPSLAPVVARRAWLQGARRALMDRAIAAKFAAR